MPSVYFLMLDGGCLTPSSPGLTEATTLHRLQEWETALRSRVYVFAILVILLLMWQNTTTKATFWRKCLFVLQFQRDESQCGEPCLQATGRQCGAEAWVHTWDSSALERAGAFGILKVSPQWQATSSTAKSPKAPQIAPPTRDWVFKQGSPQGTFSFKPPPHCRQHSLLLTDVPI